MASKTPPVRHLLPLAHVLAAVLALPAAAQTTTPAGGDIVPPAPPARHRPTLIREGSHLVAVQGTLQRDTPRGPWHFRLLDDGAIARTAPMPLLPCTLLTSLEQIVEGSGAETVFEMTGEVFVFRGKNYLLPTHSPRVASYAPPMDDGPGVVAEEVERPQDIIRRLEREIGPVPRLPAALQPTGDGGRRLLREGTLIRWRRGWMTREPTGTWVFTFAAGATGNEDPPMVLLPCLLMEQMERQVEQGGRMRVLLVSGRVLRYDRRNYLLPTAFRVPRERTPLRP